jgi:uncharacterized membrane protein YhaH (DUF805 family)
MANPIIRGFSKLTQFSGRDSRGEFWPHVGAVIALLFVAQSIGMGWMMSDFMGKLQAYADEQPVLLIEEPVPADTSVRVEVTERAAAPEPPAPPAPPIAPPPMPDFRILSGIMAGSVALAVGLLAAAVSRRLHDRNMAAPWGLLPVPFLLIATIGFPLMMQDFMTHQEPNFGLFGLLFLNNIAYLAALVTLIVLLVQRGTPGPSRYGAATIAPTMNPRDDWSTPG